MIKNKGAITFWISMDKNPFAFKDGNQVKFVNQDINGEHLTINLESKQINVIFNKGTNRAISIFSPIISNIDPVKNFVAVSWSSEKILIMFNDQELFNKKFVTNIKKISISGSPENPSIDEAFGLTFQLHAPYNKDEVTLLINPNITDYEDSMGDENVSIRHLTFSEHTPDTKIIKFDFGDNNVKKIGGTYIKLEKIGTIVFENQEFLTFDFFIEDISTE
ncbi:hypothetical protein [Lacinutrix himadriensis]|uniref:hypothetical protein n=1 Tax=Lacinutrix himadriensis TaxID=641549 RepID=UPI0006E28847|nr:hypothetical protein [Lacinutrix himadriensis]